MPTCRETATDIVRIRNGDVCYWPNLGYGCFGAKVTMDNAPWFDTPDQFDPRRLRLADIDGSGVTDIIYLDRNQTRLWFNQSGNAWSQTNELPGFPGGQRRLRGRRRSIGQRHRLSRGPRRCPEPAACRCSTSTSWLREQAAPAGAHRE